MDIFNYRILILLLSSSFPIILYLVEFIEYFDSNDGSVSEQLLQIDGFCSMKYILIVFCLPHAEIL